MGKTRDRVKKIGNTKGTFHAKMGTIKDRKGKDLTETEEIKKRWQEHTEKLFKKGLAAAKSLESCPTLCDPIDYSPPGSSVPRISPGKNTGVSCHFLLPGKVLMTWITKMVWSLTRAGHPRV